MPGIPRAVSFNARPLKAKRKPARTLLQLLVHSPGSNLTPKPMLTSNSASSIAEKLNLKRHLSFPKVIKLDSFNNNVFVYLYLYNLVIEYVHITSSVNFFTSGCWIIVLALPRSFETC